jgi:hypothetical protein
MTFLQDLPRFGDKKNSDFFEDALLKIYARRVDSGLDALLGKMQALVLQTQHGEAGAYMRELTFMMPYRFEAAYENASHMVYTMRNPKHPEAPVLFILEPLLADYTSHVTALNMPFARASEKPQVKYIGEIYHTTDLAQTKAILAAQEFRILKNCANKFLINPNIATTEASYFTHNHVMYSESDFASKQTIDALQLGAPAVVSTAIEKDLLMADQLQEEKEVKDLVQGLDHLATRVFSGDREHAILEFMSLTPYYFWGAYNIAEMNSSTNVCRFPRSTSELDSPAKVFTANNTPFYFNSIINLPSPTETFVRNFGRRMHHMAVAVTDGEKVPGVQKNIDYVVSVLEEGGIPFLAKVFGECTDEPDLKQIFSKTSPYSFLITEYVQRCHGFAGFFTRKNVADLTAAAGEDASLREDCDEAGVDATA